MSVARSRVVGLARLTLLCSLGLAAGCSPLSTSEPPPDRFRLDAGRGAIDAADALPASLVLVRPTLPGTLDTDHIVLFDGTHGLTHYAGVRWAMPARELIHHTLIDALDGARVDGGGAGRSVDPALSRRAAWELRVAVRDFQAASASAGSGRAPELEVGLVVALVEVGSGRITAEARVRRDARAEANRVTAVAEGLNRLLLSAFADAVSEIAAALE